MMGPPSDLVPCDEVLQCVNPDPCDTCAETDPLFPSDVTVASLVRGRFYRAKARTPDGEPTPSWWIPELDGQPFVIRCGCGLHFGLSWVLRCASHFGTIDEEKIPDVIERIEKIKRDGPRPVDPVKEPDLEEV